MTIYNTSSDSANTAVRAFLTKVGEYYLDHSFNTASGRGKALWNEIKTDFENSCAYCGEQGISLQVEHVIMFNRTEFGSHHPGNVIPCCKECNKRTRNKEKSYSGWEEHLKEICKKRGELKSYKKRHDKISKNFIKFKYPVLNDKEQHAIRVIANSLYENIKTESEKSLSMYKQLDEAFVKR